MSSDHGTIHLFALLDPRRNKQFRLVSDCLSVGVFVCVFAFWASSLQCGSIALFMCMVNITRNSPGLGWYFPLSLILSLGTKACLGMLPCNEKQSFFQSCSSGRCTGAEVFQQQVGLCEVRNSRRRCEPRALHLCLRSRSAVNHRCGFLLGRSVYSFFRFLTRIADS